MTLRPGRNLIRAGVALLVLSFAAVVWPVALSLVAVAVVILAAACVFDAWAGRQRIGQIDVARLAPASVRRDVPFAVQLQLTNHSDSPARGTLRDVQSATAEPRLVVNDVSISANGQQTFRYELRIPRRGRHDVGPIWLRIGGPLSLIETQRLIEDVSSVRVLPEVFASPGSLEKDHRAHMLLLDKMARARSHGAGTEFESLHEYRTGDDPRRIDWRATARQRRPIVRRYQIERHRDVMILVDAGRLMGSETPQGLKLDCAIDSALMLARVALQGGDRCGLAVFDNEVRAYHPPVSGVPSLNSLVNAAYDAQTDWRESDFGRMFAMLQARQSKRSLIVLISDVVDEATSTQFRSSLATLAKRHAVLFAALRTPVLDGFLAERVDSMEAAYRKVVVFRLQRDRALALQSLRHTGIEVLDIAPTELTVPLISRFIELRSERLG